MKPFAVLLLLLFVSPLSAERVKSLRCGNDFLRLDDDKFALIRACGKPLGSDLVSGFREPVTERLWYEVNRRDVVITIREGKIVDIEYLR